MHKAMLQLKNINVTTQKLNVQCIKQQVKE